MLKKLFSRKGVIKQAGAIAVRGNGDKVEVLIVESRKNPGNWIFPKGHVERGESLEETAVRELEEEGGVVGKVLKFVGVTRYDYKDASYEVHYFLTRAIDTVRKRERDIQWLTPSRARKAVAFDESKKLLDRALEILSER